MSVSISLTPRLSQVAKTVSPCTVLADIGTDHAHLPIAMILEGQCTRAFACDVNEGPLQRARAAVGQYGLGEAISTVRSDGLRSVPKTFDALVIAGMGGDLIARILQECPPDPSVKIALQPMTKPEVLRRFLFSEGYVIHEESAVREGEKCYVVFSVFRGGEAISFSEIDCYLPRNLACTQDALFYLEKRLSAHEKRLLGLRRAEAPEADAISFEAEVSRRLTAQWQLYSRRLYDEAH